MRHPWLVPAVGRIPVLRPKRWTSGGSPRSRPRGFRAAVGAGDGPVGRLGSADLPADVDGRARIPGQDRPAHVGRKGADLRRDVDRAGRRGTCCSRRPWPYRRPQVWAIQRSDRPGSRRGRGGRRPIRGRPAHLGCRALRGRPRRSREVVPDDAAAGRLVAGSGGAADNVARWRSDGRRTGAATLSERPWAPGTGSSVRSEQEACPSPTSMAAPASPGPEAIDQGSGAPLDLNRRRHLRTLAPSRSAPGTGST